MKNIRNTIFAILLLLVHVAVFAQNTKSFSVKKIGNGNQNVILIPGYSCSGKVWDETLPLISTNNTCYVITFSGFTGEQPQTNPALTTWVADLASYIKDEKIQKPVIIGHSLGGLVAAWLAADYPTLISKIAIVDALPSLSAYYNPAFVAQPTPDCSQFVSQFTTMTDEQFYSMQKMTLPMMLATAEKAPMIIDWSVKSDRNTLAQIYCQFLNTDLRPKLSSIACKTLVMLNAPFRQNDSIIQKQYKSLANKNIKYADKGLHFIMFDDQKWFLKELKQFLNNDF
jgi:pimeloyl-ACP methyl ester carboxylesterase